MTRCDIVYYCVFGLSALIPVVWGIWCYALWKEFFEPAAKRWDEIEKRKKETNASDSY